MLKKAPAIVTLYRHFPRALTLRICTSNHSSPTLTKPDTDKPRPPPARSPRSQKSVYSKRKYMLTFQRKSLKALTFQDVWQDRCRDTDAGGERAQAVRLEVGVAVGLFLYIVYTRIHTRYTHACLTAGLF
jgi:hypothetical protein